MDEQIGELSRLLLTSDAADKVMLPTK